MHTTSKKITSAIAAIVAGASCQTLFAQEDQGGGILEEIIVTAEHREASLQDTQISISAFSAQDIQDLGIKSTVDLGNVAPNIVINSLQGGKSGVAVNMRGIGQNETLVAFDPAVGLYIDDVLISKNVGAVLDVLDLERVEILRGPQGTLYGRNTMGGTINFVSKKPTDEFEGKLSTTVGNYGQLDVIGVLNVPLAGEDSGIGALNMRLTAASIQRDGLTDNDYSGPSAYATPLSYDADLYGNGGDDYSELRKVNKELETKDREVLMVHLGWDPSDKLSLLYTYDMTRIDEVPGTPWATVTNPASSFGPLVEPFAIGVGVDRPDSISVNGAHAAVTDVDGHALHIDYEISDSMTFKSITASREMENFSTADSDGTPLAMLQTVDTNSTDQFTQEFRLTGTTLSDRLDYTLGVFYMDESGEVDNRVDALLLLGFPVGGPSRTVGEFDNTSYALYGQATYALTDQWNLTFGARYTAEDREMSKVWYPSVLDKLIRFGYPDSIDFGKADKSFNNFSPMASISYNWSDDVMTYFKVSTGFQSGGFNVRDVNVTETAAGSGVYTPLFFQDGFDEETLIAYEFGVKSDIADRVRLNAALWYSDYDDKLVSLFDPVTLSNNVQNAGVVEIYGLELELLAQLSETVQLGLNYGLQKPSYKKYDSYTADPNNPGQVIVDDLSDTEFPYTPENSVGAYIAYEKEVGIGYFRSRLDWAWKDDYRFRGTGNGLNSQESYSIVNGRISLEDVQLPGDLMLRVALWGKNLTDEPYYFNGVDIYDTFGFDINLYAEPRTYGLDLEISF